jgi:hypothetical protein
MQGLACKRSALSTQSRKAGQQPRSRTTTDVRRCPYLLPSQRERSQWSLSRCCRHWAMPVIGARSPTLSESRRSKCPHCATPKRGRSVIHYGTRGSCRLHW